MGASLLHYGVQSAFSESLKILKYDKMMAEYMISVGAVILIACGLGWISGTAKSHSLGYFVSPYKTSHLSIVWVPVPRNHPDVLITGFRYFDNQRRHESVDLKRVSRHNRVL